MKKKLLIGGIIIGLAVTATGCASGTISNDYVTISNYKGVEVDKIEGIPEITDDAVENNIETVLKGFSKIKEVTGRAAKEGDVVVLDYTASADGKTIEGGGASDYELELGSNSFFKEFEESIVGHNKGDTFELQHEFESDYTNTAFAGKKVIFSITVKSINEQEVPDLTDDFVQQISQKSKTVKEYKKEMRELLEENNEEYVMSELEESAWAKVLENTEVKKYPEDQIEEEKQTLYDHYQKGADYYEMEFADFLKQMDMTEEQFEENVSEAAKTNVKENVTVEAIAKKEKIELSDKEYEKAEEALAEEMGYESVESMKEEAPEKYIKNYILRDKVKTWVAENCVQVESEK